MGYGFCWMTLRDVTLFGKSEKERTWAFSMFLAGLYAGKNCGQMMGSILMVYLGPKIAELFRRTLGNKPRSGHWYNVFFSTALVFFGISGGFGAVAVTIVIMALVDGFGFGVQKDTFLSLSKKFRIFRKHGLSWYSFLVKLAGILGPLIFGFVLEAGKYGILFTGIAFVGMAVLAGFVLRITSENEKSS